MVYNERKPRITWVMLDRNRLKNGKFAPKSDENREVRSLRLTSTAWQRLGDLADSRCITRADLIEDLAHSSVLDPQAIDGGVNLQQVKDEAAKVLNDSVITRGSKDRGSVRRALEALIDRLSSS